MTSAAIREDRFHLTGENDQSRQSAGCIESQVMLGAENGRLLSNRPVARTINPLLTIWANAQVSDELQALDDANKILLGWCFRQITQPGEWRAISVVSIRDQRPQFSERPLFQSLVKILVRLLSGPCASRQTDAFCNCRRRRQNATSSTNVDHGGNDYIASNRANSFGRRDLRNGPIITAGEGMNPQMRLYFPMCSRRVSSRCAYSL
jgi:hypothetical protein